MERTWLCRNERAEASDLDVVRAALHVKLIERLDRRFRLAFDVAEGGEIVLADEALRRDMHRRGVERLGDAPGAAALEGQIGAAIDDAIEIVPLDRGEARVEAVRRPLGLEDRNRMRTQMRVQGVAHRVFLPLLGEIEMTDLPERMHAGVGAPGAVHAHLLPAERLDRGCQHALHGGAVVLDLPADERPAVILDGELVTGHDGT